MNFSSNCLLVGIVIQLGWLPHFFSSYKWAYKGTVTKSTEEYLLNCWLESALYLSSNSIIIDYAQHKYCDFRTTACVITYINRFDTSIGADTDLLIDIQKIRSILAKSIIDTTNIFSCVDAIANVKNCIFKLYAITIRKSLIVHNRN